MNKSRYLRKFSIILAVLGICGMTAAFATDSTHVKALPVKTAPQTYLLAQGDASTQTYSDYTVNQLATTLRCSSNTTPVLSTSVNSVSVYGNLQAIEGVHNEVTLNPATYIISGRLSAPVNIAGAYDNGASIHWQIWCQPNQAA